MATVTFSASVGGDGSTVDDTTGANGLAGYGYVTRLVPAFSNIVNIAANTVTQAAAAAASAASALNAPGTNATSSTSVAIATGSKSFTIQTGKAYVVGQTLNVASAANPANYMAGQITSYNSGTGALVVNVAQTGGSGTFTDWVVSMGVIVSSTLPSQTGNSGKFLTTNGTAASWGVALVPASNLSDVSSTTTARTNLSAAKSGANSDITSLSALSTPLSVAQGGTGGATASAARTALGAAASGANSDITSLASLSTPLSVAQGGSGASTASGARTNFGLGTMATQAASAVAITGGTITGITDLAVADGGTGAGTASAARGNLGAAASGANSDITSLSALSTPLSIGQGGTGSATAATARTALGVYAVWPGLGTISGGVLTDQFSPGFSIARSSTGVIVVTLDSAAASASSWSCLANCSNLSTDASEQIACVEQYNLKSTTSTTFHIRENAGNALRDPDWINFNVYVNA